MDVKIWRVPYLLGIGLILERGSKVIYFNFLEYVLCIVPKSVGDFAFKKGCINNWFIGDKWAVFPEAVPVLVETE